jgi:hypothetical protein
MLADQFLTFRRIVSAAAAIWLWGAEAALAGAGGGAAGVIPALQKALNMVCEAVQVPVVSCPQLPSVTQLIVEIASLTNLSPEMVRYANGISPTVAVNAGNPPQSSRIPVFNATPNPIAFVSPPNNQGEAAATELYDPDAQIFFYAVTTRSGAQPDTFHFIFDFLPRIRRTFQNGENVAEILLPLVLLNRDGSERPVPTTVRIGAICTGGVVCLTADAVGDFTGSGTPQSHSAAELGLNVSLTFGPSLISTDPHAIFEVDVGLIVTHKNNPAHFNLVSPAITPAFTADGLGFTPPLLGSPLGIAPNAGVITAQFSRGGDVDAPAGANRIGVTAVVAIGTDGEALASEHLP